MMQAAESIGPMTPELLAALEARGFDAEAFLKLDLGVGESRHQAGALAIPFYDGHNVVGVKVRAIEQGLAGFGQAKQFGTGGIFYNLNCLSDPELANEPLIVAEGEPGCWAALVAGFPRSVGIPIASADGRREVASRTDRRSRLKPMRRPDYRSVRRRAAGQSPLGVDRPAPDRR